MQGMGPTNVPMLLSGASFTIILTTAVLWLGWVVHGDLLLFHLKHHVLWSILRHLRLSALHTGLAELLNAQSIL